MPTRNTTNSNNGLSPPAGCFSALLTVISLYGGILLGCLISIGLLSCGPGLLPLPEHTWSGVFLLILAFESLYTPLMLLIWYATRSRPLAGRGRRSAIWLGLVSTISGFGYAGLLSMGDRGTGGYTGVELIGWLALAAVMTAWALLTPFLLLQAPARPRAYRATVRSITIGVPLLGIVLVVARQWFRARVLNRDFAPIAAWVKSTDADPVPFRHLNLPGNLRAASADGAVDATVTTDGRVILLLKTELTWHHNWTGIIYCSTPVHTGEVGTDAYGRPELRFHGLPEHFIERRLDGRRFRVAYDLG